MIIVAPSFFPASSSASSPGRVARSTPPICWLLVVWLASLASYTCTASASAALPASRVKTRVTPSAQPVTMSPSGVQATLQTDPGCCSVATTSPSRTILQVLSSPEAATSMVGSTATQYRKLSEICFASKHSPLTAHSRTLPSLPHETKPTPGKRARLRTQSVCPTYVCTHLPSRQSLHVLSAEAVTSPPSSSGRTDHTACSCPSSLPTDDMLERSHTMAVLSHEAE
mmetsp:Transcript_18062/g.41820  ORF Transcript_18062/g.41820 Transcript_18062/m.41820 type:complete len:227 (-) Transcript_18062:561-1241(-)